MSGRHSPAGAVTIDRPELAEPSTYVVPCLMPKSARDLGPLIDVRSSKLPFAGSTAR